MSKLLLVDDESVTRRGLLRSIPWKALGISETMEARDGAEALRLAQKFRPDIMVTDVRMPKLNGIELAAEVRKLFPSVKLIFISGYSDKEYLMAAIRLGVIGYVEKPIDLDEITEVIRRAAEQAGDSADNISRDFLPLVRQDMVYRLIKPGADVPNLQRGLALLDLRLNINAWYAALVVKVNGGAFLLRDWMTRLENASPEIVLCEKEDHIVVLLQGVDLLSLQAAREMALEKIRAQSDAYLAFTALGAPVQGMAQIHASYEQAVVASESLFFLGFGHARLYGQHEAASPAPEGLEAPFLKLLSEGRYDELDECVQGLCQRLIQPPHISANHAKRLFLRLFLALQREAEGQRVELDVPCGVSEDQLWTTLSDCGMLAQLKALLLHTIGAFTDRIKSAQSVNRKVASALRLIEDQYANPGLDVTSLANQVRLTQPYLSVLFKKTVGHSVSEYLLELRIEKSKQLLIEDDIRLSEVAGRVGYYDANAYAKAFKRTTGLSPAKFRQKYQR